MMKTRCGISGAVLAVLLCLVLPAAGCSGSNPGDRVLAKVGNTKITQADLDLFVRKTFADRYPEGLDRQTRARMIESLVKSRAMALEGAKDLTRSEEKEMKRKLDAYREELLVNRYLKRHAGLKPLTADMVRDYYLKHQEEFGGSSVKVFEYVKAAAPADEGLRDKVIQTLGGLKGVGDWQAAAPAGNGLDLAYNRAKLSADMLDQPLRSLVEGTAKGQVSQVSVGKEIVVVRVIDEIEQPAKPLEEVSAEIRRKLAPVMMKDVVGQASAQAMAKTRVSYAGDKR